MKFSRARRPGRLAVRSFLAAILLAMGLGGAAHAQFQGKGAPTALYNVSLSAIYDGSYSDALKSFQQQWRGAIKNGTTRWIDSICYHAMIGECHYQAGELGPALEHYTMALRLYTAFPDWMMRVKFDAQSIRPSSQSPQTPWGASTRGTRIGLYPEWMSILQGQINTSDQVKAGGQITPPLLYPIQVDEIVYATALAMRRRTELLGPMAKYDQLVRDVLAVTSQPIGPRNHWAQCWADVQIGLAMIAGGREMEAVPVLKRSLAAAGEFDHPLTATALLEMGRIALRQGDRAAAAKLFLEATYPAFHYGDYIVLEEAFRYATLTHFLSNEKSPYAPLAPAIAWTQNKDVRHLRASLLLCAAEDQMILGQTGPASVALDQAQQAMMRRTMAAGAIGARLAFLRATNLFQQRKIEPGLEALGGAMKYMQGGGSLWLFHIAQADAYVLNAGGREMSPRKAVDLYSFLLRDPDPLDWAVSPMESLAVLLTPHVEPLEHWFLMALRGTDSEMAVPAALEVADRLRRHRLFNSLAMGGRLLSLRWILEADEQSLDPTSLLQRQDLLGDYPVYQKIAEQARQIRDRLHAAPLEVDGEAQRKVAPLVADYARISLQQEAVLHEIAIRRAAAGMAFPPLRSVKQVQNALPEGSATLSFITIGGANPQYHGFLLNRTKCVHWIVKNPAGIAQKISTFLRDIGNYDSNREVSSKELADAAWKQNGQQLLGAILDGSQADFSTNFAELVVVPDGIFWYLPFEALSVSAGNQLQPLIQKVRVRYSPTLGLSIADGRGRANKPSTTVVLGKLFPRDSDDVARAAFDRMSKTVSNSVALGGPLPGGSSLHKSRMGNLVVLDDLTGTDQSPYGWSPVQAERGKPGSTVNDWLTLPWGGPEAVVLPGYHTMAENPRKKTYAGPVGAEMFLSTCGLMASGTRTVLVSRWRTGGQLSFDLVREFVQELPHTSPADAWQRAVLLGSGSRLNLDAEPRVKANPGEQLKGDHPFLWAGYMLVDRGLPIDKQALDAAEPPPTTKPGEKPAAKPAEAGAFEKARDLLEPDKDKGDGEKKPDDEPEDAAAKPAAANDPPAAAPDPSPEDPAMSEPAAAASGKTPAKKPRAPSPSSRRTSPRTKSNE